MHVFSQPWEPDFSIIPGLRLMDNDLVLRCFSVVCEDWGVRGFQELDRAQVAFVRSLAFGAFGRSRVFKGHLTSPGSSGTRGCEKRGADLFHRRR